MGDDFAKWLLRIVGVIGLIAFGTTYAVRHDWSQGWMPSANPDYAPPAATAPETAATAPRAAPVQAPGPAISTPVAAPATPSATTAPTASRANVPCQPIGRTAKGELVYSMDCRSLPAP
ncbi:hypothetical protein LPW26_23320 [Rhodopseudomonas sp. HC1]|uniref:hypothetical protein n=1 Tax=Rhodopseudomonas infernalis TaxID=2897386 RepID=UPI001EE94A35|nr:hypothetical protein [Rhodopseudomonas infernalis]MCG6207586.1 hypothetical protein [Rhodopseudomonas infernalis]